MELTITIIIWKEYEIRILPLYWYLIPKWSTLYNLGSKKKWVKVKTFTSSGNENTKTFVRKYHSGGLIKWLCFQFQFLYWKENEYINTIYPANYNCETDPDAKLKFEMLCATDFFS